jgi:hypothetical protein
MSPILWSESNLIAFLPSRRGFFASSINALVEKIRIERIIHAFLVVQIVKVYEFLADWLMLRIVSHLKNVGRKLFLTLLEGIYTLIHVIIGFIVCLRVFPVCHGCKLGFFYMKRNLYNFCPIHALIIKGLWIQIIKLPRTNLHVCLASIQ